MDVYKFFVTCPERGEFWVRNHCDRNAHKLIKHSRDNYHKEEYSSYPWYVKCPKCDCLNDSRAIGDIDDDFAF